MVTPTLNSYFGISKLLDYMQYYMMPPKQYEHIVAKLKATVTWLDEDQNHVCFVTWLDYFFFAFT